jgi:hypothetical protein
MPEAQPGGRKRGPDLLAVVLLGLLVLGGAGAAYGAVRAGYMTATALAGVVIVGGAFVFVHSTGSKPAPPKNPQVHGAARAASEEEARRAARGEAGGPRLDDREF